MQTFTLLPQRWWVVRAFGRNPVVRLSDRVGVLLVLLACAVSIIAAPVAGAVGTAVYDAHSLRYAEQAQTRHPVTATVSLRQRLQVMSERNRQLETENRQLREALAVALGEQRTASIVGRPGDTPRKKSQPVIGPC